jgi:hypothetical protein
MTGQVKWELCVDAKQFEGIEGIEGVSVGCVN